MELPGLHSAGVAGASIHVHIAHVIRPYGRRVVRPGPCRVLPFSDHLYSTCKNTFCIELLLLFAFKVTELPLATRA